MRDTPSRPGRRGRAMLARLALLLSMLCMMPTLAACSSGTVATPGPSVAAVASATAARPAPPPTAAATRPGTATAPPAATATRTGTPAAATRAATPGGTPSGGRRQTPGATPLVPVGELPAGWRVYRGALPFTIAHPPDWTAEEDAARGLLYLYAPDPARATFLVIAVGAPERDPNLDVLRDRWFQARVAPCARFAVDATGQERHGGLDFATVGATCDLPDGLAYSLTGIGLLGTAPWIYELDAPYADFATVRDATFAPILATWQIDR